MRSLFATLLLAALLATAAPARAQLRADLPGQPAGVAVYDAPAVPSLRSLFNVETLKFSQSYEASYSSMGGSSLGLGVYTSSLRWQPTANLAGRVDVSVAHSPFGSADAQAAAGLGGDTPARVFLRNAELAYRPTANSVIHLQFRQSPYGAYADPYGTNAYGAGAYGGAYGYGSRFGATFAPSDHDALFWRDAR